MANLQHLSPLINVGLMGCGGYLFGKLTGYSPKLMALTFAIAAIARYCFSYCCAALGQYNSRGINELRALTDHVASFIGTMAAFRLSVIHNIFEGIGMFLVLECSLNLSTYATNKIIEAAR